MNLGASVARAGSGRIEPKPGVRPRSKSVTLL